MKKRNSYTVNISLQELKDAVKFAEENSTSKFKTVTLEFTYEGGIGTGISISDVNNQKDQKDITDVSCW